MTPTAANALAAPGTVLAGKLRVERLIGQGAMGIVLEATDITLRRRVAVKLVHPDFVNDQEKKKRFGREAYAVARLQSQHVPHVLEISELDDGTPYLVMELLEGRTLDVVLEKEGPAAIHVALDWVLQALDAIAEAHNIDLVHRDLKPANLYLARRADRPPIVKVLDFGLVKDLSVDAAKLTITGSTMGSPAYMAPEQVNVDQTIDARTDVWALGVTLFELLTHELPFDGRSIPSMLRQILHDEATPLRAKRPDAPPELEMVIRRCLAKQPDARYTNAADLARALASVRAKLPQVTEATRTVRLAEGTVIPQGMSAMDMMDISKVRPRLPVDSDGEVTIDAPKKKKKRPPAQNTSSMQIALSAMIATLLTTAVLAGGFYLFRDKLLPPPRPQASTPPPSLSPPPTAVATPSQTAALEPAPPPTMVGTTVTNTPGPVTGVTIDFPGPFTDADQAKWHANATAFVTCGKKATAACERHVLITRSPGSNASITGAPGCTLPKDEASCIELVVKKADLVTTISPKEAGKTTFALPVKLTFH